MREFWVFNGNQVFTPGLFEMAGCPFFFFFLGGDVGGGGDSGPPFLVWGERVLLCFFFYPPPPREKGACSDFGGKGAPGWFRGPGVRGGPENPPVGLVFWGGTQPPVPTGPKGNFAPTPPPQTPHPHPPPPGWDVTIPPKNGPNPVPFPPTFVGGEKGN